MPAGLISKATGRVLSIAGVPKTNINKNIAEAEVRGTIADLNSRFNWAVLEEQDTSKSFAGGSSNHTITMPVDFAKMRRDGFGEYDSTNERMKRVWTKKTEDWFHRSYSGAMTLTISGSNQSRIWFFVPDNDAGLKQVRAYPAPSTSMPVMIRYYAMLTQSNVDRLRDATVLVDGAMWRLPKWFSNEEWGTARTRYLEFVTSMKAQRRSVDTGVSPMPDRRIQAFNATGWAIK